MNRYEVLAIKIEDKIRTGSLLAGEKLPSIRDLGRQEYARMKGELYDLMTAKLGTQVRDHFLEDWRMLTVVLDKGELRPGRLWGRKPA